MRTINKKKVLVMARIPCFGLSALYDNFEVVYPDNFAFNEDELKKMIVDVDALLSVFTLPVQADLLKLASRLRIISNFGVGYNNIDLEYASAHGITICNTPNSVTEPTAEMAMGLLISVMRRIGESDRKLRSDRNFKWGMMENLGHTLYGKTLGIIGMGRIGKAFARRAVASGMTIRYYNRSPLCRTEEAALDAQWLPFDELLQSSDVISLNCPLTSTTFHLIGDREFQLMKNGAFIINTARGSVVDEQALIKYLTNGKLGGAGLDVFENEPSISSELLRMDHVVLTPHNGTGTIDARIATAIEASDSIVRFFKGDLSLPIVNR